MVSTTRPVWTANYAGPLFAQLEMKQPLRLQPQLEAVACDTH